MTPKLYGHSQDLARALSYIQHTRSPYWKAIDPDANTARTVSEQGTRLIVRYSGMDGIDWNYSARYDTEALATRFYRECRGQEWYQYAWAVETPNEPFPVWDCSMQYVQFMRRLVELFALDGKECIVGNFGTHQGEPPTVHGATYYGLHRYWWDGGPQASAQGAIDTVLALPLDAKFFVTECGRTAALNTNVPPGQDGDLGWRSAGGPSPLQYFSELNYFDGLMGSDDRYRGSFIFQLGGNQDWESFEVLGTDVAGWLANNMLPEKYKEVLVPKFEFKFGFRAEVDRLKGLEDDPGEPLMNEAYLGTDFAYQFTTKGVLVYDKTANVVHFLAAW